MTSLRTETCVIDASVAIKLFVHEPLSGKADLLFDWLAENHKVRFFVPDLFYLECANILWKYTTRCKMPPAQARANLKRLKELELIKSKANGSWMMPWRWLCGTVLPFTTPRM